MKVSIPKGGQIIPKPTFGLQNEKSAIKIIPNQ